MLAAPMAGLVDPGTAGEAARGLLADVVLKRLAAGRAEGSEVRDQLAVGATTVVNLDQLKSDTAIDAALVASVPACPAEGAAAGDDASLCRDFVFSAPVFQVVNGFFGRPDGPAFDTDDAAIGRSVCVAAGTDLAPLDAGGRNWVADERLTLLRHGSLEACFAQLTDGKVEWVYTDEFSGRATLARLDPDSAIGLREQPVAVTGFHLAIPRARPGAAELLLSVNGALTSPAAAEATAALVAERLGRTGTLARE